LDGIVVLVDDLSVDDVVRLGEQGAGVLVGPALGQGLRRGPPDGRVAVGGGAVGEQCAGVLVGPALGQGLHRRQLDGIVLVDDLSVDDVVLLGEQGGSVLVELALGPGL
jgi:hypothetical protein